MQVPEAMPLRICVYLSPDNKDEFVAHCLELDLIATNKCLQAAVSDLLGVIETQLDTCQETNAQVYFPASQEVWDRYMEAKKAGKKIPDELLARIVDEANKRLGRKSPPVDDVWATKEAEEAERLLEV